ncbi:uncharacterized protein LOC117243769 [Parus major]|uniref:uncharacterized protein LOC117243769 n=1 Tax=Parus major TaxID=9157 RepID=UPI0014449449|nr:uncharacterized protein LOC117243769 [Parus major]
MQPSAQTWALPHPSQVPTPGLCPIPAKCPHLGSASSTPPQNCPLELSVCAVCAAHLNHLTTTGGEHRADTDICSQTPECKILTKLWRDQRLGAKKSTGDLCSLFQTLQRRKTFILLLKPLKMIMRDDRQHRLARHHCWLWDSLLHQQSIPEMTIGYQRGVQNFASTRFSLKMLRDTARCLLCRSGRSLITVHSLIELQRIKLLSLSACCLLHPSEIQAEGDL